MFAATAWPLQGATNNHLAAAFALCRNYGGEGSVVGDTAVAASTSDRVQTSVYAFTHSDLANAAESVAINKQASSQSVTIQTGAAPAFTSVAVYELLPGHPGVTPASGAAPSITWACNRCSLTFTMPARSASTIVLR